MRRAARLRAWVANTPSSAAADRTVSSWEQRSPRLTGESAVASPTRRAVTRPVVTRSAEPTPISTQVRRRTDRSRLAWAATGPKPRRLRSLLVRAVVTPALALAALGLTAMTGCSAQLPEGKPWTVDTSAWTGAPGCTASACALDAYATRDFAVASLLPDVLVEGRQVQAHCFVPMPSTVRDPSGRDGYRWYLITVDTRTVWAPDIALTAEADVRRDPDEPGDHLAAGLAVCHSGVPGR